MLFPRPSLLLAAALAALAAPTAVLQVQSLQIKPSPPPHPPKSLTSLSSSGNGPTVTTPRPTAWNRGGGGRGGSGRQRRSSTTPLRAYTVSENVKNPWLSFMKFPTSFAELASQFGAEDSLLSFEGGSSAKAAARPYMPNLEMEMAAITATKEKDVDFDTEKDELLVELKALTKTFDDLQSSMDYKSQLYSDTIKGFESKIESLEEKNVLLEEGLDVLTSSLERQEQQIERLQKEKDDNAAKEGERANDDIDFLLQVQNNVKCLEKENDMLRQRLRFLEVELSDIAFESRRAAVTTAPAAGSILEDAQSPSAEAVASINNAKLSPKAPSAPAHIYQQRQLEQLQQQVDAYERDRSSVRKLFGLGICRGVSKVGNALNLWRPVYLLLWGELRGKMVM